MFKYKIVSKITITRSGRSRVATFLARQNRTNKQIPITMKEDSIQALLASIEKSYNTFLFADDYSYNFPLRKDEVIPTAEKRPDKIVCSFDNCNAKAEFKTETEFLCAPHFFQSEKTNPIVRPVKKQQRNDICSCGSKLKYKTCCALKIERVSGRNHYQPQPKIEHKSKQ